MLILTGAIKSCGRPQQDLHSLKIATKEASAQDHWNRKTINFVSSHCTNPNLTAVKCRFNINLFLACLLSVYDSARKREVSESSFVQSGNQEHTSIFEVPQSAPLFTAQQDPLTSDAEISRIESTIWNKRLSLHSSRSQDSDWTGVSAADQECCAESCYTDPQGNAWHTHHEKTLLFTFHVISVQGNLSLNWSNCCNFDCDFSNFMRTCTKFAFPLTVVITTKKVGDGNRAFGSLNFQSCDVDLCAQLLISRQIQTLFWTLMAFITI